ncbi:MAG: T9SS C-terminal target domain-containing protein [Prevotella sp.]|nr:T9SS C-terminal target domain-containing protein [Prevotella sp.]
MRPHGNLAGKATLRLLTTASLLLCYIMTSIPLTAQELPQLKVDLSIANRSDEETLEPGYTCWRVKQGKSDTMTENGITLTLSCPADADYDLRTGWSKSYIQNAENKSKNGRLTFDGINLDPNTYGTFTLRIEGLSAGQHTLQTYHNCWENAERFYAAPMTIRCNGVVAHERVDYSFGQAVAANACLVTTTFTISEAGEAVEIEFSTTPDAPGTPTAGQTNAYMPPMCNGFELNTASIISQAKDPFPASGDIHVDADDTHSIELRWSPANSSVSEHRLYFGLDSASVAAMTSPTAILTDTTYQVTDLYSMNTYYWRVDEVDTSGNVTEGKIWKFKPRQLAFPGAEGYGRFAQGGRGGSVYHVTNLNNDHTPGTLLYGLVDIDEPHTIVFDVSGIIVMDFNAVFAKPYITIAGQTAPGKGICIKHSNVNIGSDNICRFMRFKRGYGDTGNALGMTGADHSIIDHTTAAWGTDETFSSRGAKNITFQYSIIAEALGIADHKNYDPGTNHGFAATIGGEKGSFSHNLLVNCNGRNWSMGGGLDGNGNAAGELDMFNNVCYNWWGRTTDGGAKWMQFVNNYYKMGPDTKRTQLFTAQNEGGGARTQFAYVNGNIRENKNHTLTQDALNDTYNATGPEPEKTWVDTPFFESQATIHSAQDAFKIVTTDAGATMPCRDDQHVRVVRETIDGTYTYVGSRSKIKGEIDHEDDAGGWEDYPEEHRASDWDTDQDGMPDWYERLIGSDPAVANHNDDPDHDGWTLLEDYLEFMAHPYLILQPNESGTVNVAPSFRGFKKSPQYSISSASPLFSAIMQDSIITISAKELGGIGIVTMQVTDNEGTTFLQRLSVAVTGEQTGVIPVWKEEDIDVVKREYFTLDGKKVTHLKPQEVYVMKTVDTDGETHTMKVVKD